MKVTTSAGDHAGFSRMRGAPKGPENSLGIAQDRRLGCPACWSWWPGVALGYHDGPVLVARGWPGAGLPIHCQGQVSGCRRYSGLVTVSARVRVRTGVSLALATCRATRAAPCCLGASILRFGSGLCQDPAVSMVTEYLRLRPYELAELRGLLDAPGDEAIEYVEELSTVDAPDTPDSERRAIDLDKSWDGLRYLLALAGPPPVDMVSGGVPVTDQTWGYDAPRLLTPDEVASSARFLASTPFERLAANYDPAALDAADVYPGGWQDIDTGYLAGWYRSLVDYFVGAAAMGDSVLVRLA